MDKESIILKYLDLKVQEKGTEVTELIQQNENREEKLDKIDKSLEEIYMLLNKNRGVHLSQAPFRSQKDNPESNNSDVSFEEISFRASTDLQSRGFDIENLDYQSLVPKSVLNDIEEELNRSLPHRDKWVKNDYIAVFIAASIGSLADFILSDRNNSFTGKNSDFSKWLNKFHQHEGGAPIDYQGPGFSGGYHRGLSKGHDVLRFIEAILMFKNGQFEGIRYKDSIGNKIITNINQNGTPYQELGWIEAILKYAKHMFADLASTCSLPFPGSSFLVECNNRELRKLAATMYHNGFNLKNVLAQSLSTILVEVILRIYFGIESMKKYQAEYELNDDYSNFMAFREVVLPSSKDKLYEMLLLSHSVVTAVNIGKVIIKKSPWEINITEIISVIRYAIPVVLSVTERNSQYSKILRNGEDIHNLWERMISEQANVLSSSEFISAPIILE